MRVFIASSIQNGVLKIYKELASNVSTILARRGYKLILGASANGMVGSCYMTYKYEEAKVKGFFDITDASIAEELELDAIDIAPNTFTRTMRLYQSADLVVILPGGFGTLAELFSMIMEKRTKKDKKRIVLFNYNKYYDNLLYLFKDMIDERFVTDETLEQFDIVTNLEDFEKYIDEIKIDEEN